jgi:hypothetical protein
MPMKKRVILLVLMLWGVVPAMAQFAVGGPLELLVEHSDPNTAKLLVRQHERGVYTLFLDFHSTENMDIPKLLSATIMGDGAITTLKPIDPRKSWDYTFASKWTRGIMNPTKVDSNFLYRLPYDKDSIKKSFAIRYSGGDSKIVNFNVIGFRMERGDTIRAARSGVVIDVIDEFDPGDAEDEFTGRVYNSIDIQHTDGTIARYAVLEKGSMRVESGRMVPTGMPIALAGSLDGEEYQLRLHIYYQRDNLRQITSLEDHTITYYHVDPMFDTSGGKMTLRKGAAYRNNY